MRAQGFSPNFNLKERVRRPLFGFTSSSLLTAIPSSVPGPITPAPPKSATTSATRNLAVMVGGEQEIYARIKPILDAFGDKVFYAGAIGAGSVAKLVHNMIGHGIRQAIAEGLTLATKLGVDVEKLMPVIQASMIRSGVVDYKAPFVLKRDFTANFPLRLMHKDIRLTLEAAKEVRVKLPALETVEEIYEMATEDGHQDLDYAATLTLLEKWAGVEVKGASA